MTRSDGKSHVSLSVLLPDNRNCIRVTQSRRKLHKDGRVILRFPKRATSRIRANIHATYDEASSVSDIFLSLLLSRDIQLHPRYNDVTMTTAYNSVKLLSWKNVTYSRKLDLSE